MSREDALRGFYAKLVTGKAGVRDERVAAAFAATPRGRFVGPAPWHVYTASGYVETPSDDPAFLYQDVVIALAPDRDINNGEPSLHARCLGALAVRAGERVLHVGAGTGYYTALLAHLVGAGGRVEAYEIDEGLARQAAANLADLPQVRVRHRSGTDAPLPTCDVLYVSAGATHPPALWLDALAPAGGRLLFPLTPDEGLGGMLLVTRDGDAFAARFVSRAAFIPCIGARDEETAKRLAQAFGRGDMRAVRSLRRGTGPDETCWVAGDGWWLSTAAAA